MPAGVASARTLLSRPDIDKANRQKALDTLARLNKTSPVTELIAAIDRRDGAPGVGRAALDLGQMLVTTEAAQLSGVRAELERLARAGKSDVTRQSAYIALMRADGSVDRAWTLASSSSRGMIDLLQGVGLSMEAAPPARSGAQFAVRAGAGGDGRRGDAARLPRPRPLAADAGCRTRCFRRSCR